MNHNLFISFLCQLIILIIPPLSSISHKNIMHSHCHAPHFLSFQRLLNLPFLSFQIILLLIQIISLFAELFHAFQLCLHSLLAIWLYLFPRSDCELYYYFPLSAPTGVPSLSNFKLSYLFRKDLFLPQS